MYIYILSYKSYTGHFINVFDIIFLQLLKPLAQQTYFENFQQFLKLLVYLIVY